MTNQCVDVDVTMAVVVRGLRKSYAGALALRDIDLEIRRGEIFALLGPNGAGKTTTVEILEGFRGRDRGEVVVLGRDPIEGDLDLKNRIGVVLQSNGVENYLTVSETLAMYAGFYDHPRPIEEVIKLVGLSERMNDRALRLSGGQQRRLDVAIALVGDPELLFLDEPTTGFDPSARRDAWEVIKNLAKLGKTVLLTTHYMDEAQYLADTVAVINNGRIVACATPATLGHREAARARIRFRPNKDHPPPTHLVGPLDSDGFSNLSTDSVTATLYELTSWASQHDDALEGLEVLRPSLEDVYLELTAPGARQESASVASVGIEPSTYSDRPCAIRRTRRSSRNAHSIALAFSLIRFVNKSFWRNPTRVFFTFAFPLMFLVIFTSLAGNFSVHLGTRTVGSATYYVASMGAFAVISACFNNLSSSITYQREMGVLKRLKITPLPRASFLGARILHAMLVSVLLVAITAVFGRLFYSVNIPTDFSLVRFALMLVIGSSTFCALGLALSGAIPNADSAEVVINAVMFPMLFLSGVFIPFSNTTPAWITWVARVFPVKHFVDGMQSGFLSTPFSWIDLLIVAGWGVVGLLLAIRFFRWEPSI